MKVFLIESVNYHPINLYLTILKIFIIRHFLAVVSKTKSNLIQFLTKISVEIRTGKERSYGSIIQRKIISFNISTNIVKRFLTILDRHFPKSHKPHKVFNQNNVKISCISLPNIAIIINSHNKKIINNNIPKPSAPACNCRSKASYPLNGDCFQSSLAYICKADTPYII